MNLAFPLLKKLPFLQVFWCFDFKLHSSYICMMEYHYLRQHRGALWFAKSSPTGLKAVAIHEARRPRSLFHGSWHCCHCWSPASRRWFFYSEKQCCSVVVGKDNGPLSEKSAWLSRRQWADTGQAQCLHKHIDIHDRRNRHTYTDLWCSWLCRHTVAPA